MTKPLCIEASLYCRPVSASPLSHWQSSAEIMIHNSEMSVLGFNNKTLWQHKHKNPPHHSPMTPCWNWWVFMWPSHAASKVSKQNAYGQTSQLLLSTLWRIHCLQGNLKCMITLQIKLQYHRILKPCKDI